MKTVAIIGGGFSGTMTAVNLARLSDTPLRIVMINARRPLGRGTAFGTRQGEHLLNVAARNMSALPDHPTHFLQWLKSRSDFHTVPDSELREMFVPRYVFGDYVRGLLATYLDPIDDRCAVEIQSINEEAVDVSTDEDSGASVLLKSGESIDADRVLLATGNQPPASFPSLSPLSHDARYCADPWEAWHERLPETGGRIVLLGTGLTMVDAVLTLSAVGWKGTVTAVSRNGMLPRSHFRGIAYEDYIPEDAESLGLAGLSQLVEEHCGRLRQLDQNPAIAIDKLRPHTQRLWQSLTLEEKREFLDRHAATWNVTRHRIAVPIHDRMTDALESGYLEVAAGTIEQLVPGEENIEVQVRDRDGQESSIPGDLVINCTGPQPRFSQTDLPLFGNLLERGLVRTDPLDMGIEVDDHFACLDADGVVTRRLFAIGPLLKGMLWETTAVPELRGQAMRVAEVLLERAPAVVEEEHVIEYYI